MENIQIKIQSLLKQNFTEQKRVSLLCGGFKRKGDTVQIRLSLDTEFQCIYEEYPYIVADFRKPFSNEYSETNIIWSNAKYLFEGPLREKIFYCKPADGEIEKLARALIRGEKYFMQINFMCEGDLIPGLHLSERVFIDWGFFLRETTSGDEQNSIEHVLSGECPWLNNKGTPTLPQFKDFINFEKEHRHTLYH